MATGDFRPVLAEQATGHALETVDQSGQGDFWRIMHQQVDVIVLAIALDQLRPKVSTDLGKDAAQVADGRIGQHVMAVFGDEDQMDMQHVNDVPACSVFHA